MQSSKSGPACIRASQCRMMRSLIERGFLNTIPVAKQSENAYGQLFIDGQTISLTRRNQRARRSAEPQRKHGEKKSTPLHRKESTLGSVNPQTEIEDRERFVGRLKSGFLGRHGDPGLQRIADRAAQMVQNSVRQAA